MNISIFKLLIYIKNFRFNIVKSKLATFIPISSTSITYIDWHTITLNFMILWGIIGFILLFYLIWISLDPFIELASSKFQVVNYNKKKLKIIKEIIFISILLWIFLFVGNNLCDCSIIKLILGLFILKPMIIYVNYNKYGIKSLKFLGPFISLIFLIIFFILILTDTTKYFTQSISYLLPSLIIIISVCSTFLSIFQEDLNIYDKFIKKSGGCFMFPNNSPSPTNNHILYSQSANKISDEEILDNYYEVRDNPWSQSSLISERETFGKMTKEECLERMKFLDKCISDVKDVRNGRYPTYGYYRYQDMPNTDYAMREYLLDKEGLRVRIQELELWESANVNPSLKFNLKMKKLWAKPIYDKRTTDRLANVDKKYKPLHRRVMEVRKDDLNLKKT